MHIMAKIYVRIKIIVGIVDKTPSAKKYRIELSVSKDTQLI